MRTFNVGDPIQIGSAIGVIDYVDEYIDIRWHGGHISSIRELLLTAMLTPPNTTTDVIGDVQVTVHEPVLSPEVVSLARELVLTRTPQTAISDAIAFYNAVKSYKP